MRYLLEFVRGKIYEIVIGVAIAAFASFFAAKVNDMERWEVALVGSLAFIAIFGFVMFLRTELAKQSQERPTRLEDSKEMLRRQARRAPELWLSAIKVANWKTETEIVIDNIVKGSRAKDGFRKLIPEKTKVTKADISKAIVFIESLASCLHEGDLKQFPDR